MDGLNGMNLERLVCAFELIEGIAGPDVQEVRERLLKAIEAKNPKGFNQWLESDPPEDKRLREYVL